MSDLDEQAVEAAWAAEGRDNYRKKPVVVKARRLGDENGGEIVAWINGHFVDEDVAVLRGGGGGGSRGGSVLIETLEGTMTASPGDWVIRGVQHEFYPCKPDIFEATYEPVAEQVSSPERAEGGPTIVQDGRTGAEKWAGEVVGIAYCPEHGLHGARDTCFECGKPVEQVPMQVARVRSRGREPKMCPETAGGALRAACCLPLGHAGAHYNSATGRSWPEPVAEQVEGPTPHEAIAAYHGANRRRMEREDAQRKQAEIIQRGLEGILNWNGVEYNSEDLSLKSRGMLDAVLSVAEQVSAPASEDEESSEDWWTPAMQRAARVYGQTLYDSRGYGYRVREIVMAYESDVERERDAARRAIANGQEEIAMYRRIAERSQVSAPRVREDTETSETEAWFAEHFPSPAAAKTHEYAMPDVAGALLRDCARLIVRFRDLPITVSASPAGQQSARQRLRDEAKRLIERIDLAVTLPVPESVSAPAEPTEAQIAAGTQAIKGASDRSISTARQVATLVLRAALRESPVPAERERTPVFGAGELADDIERAAGSLSVAASPEILASLVDELLRLATGVRALTPVPAAEATRHAFAFDYREGDRLHMMGREYVVGQPEVKANGMRLPRRGTATMPSSRPTIRKRIEWRVNTRRHRTLSPPNMSELPWSRFAMDEQTGEIYDRRTWSRRAARRCFRREYDDLGDPVIVARFARYLTTQEIWEARDRTDEWNAQREDDAEAGGHSPAGIERGTPPAQAPDWWTPDEWDPAWTFCGHDAPDAAPVWLCEERLAAEATEEPT